MKIEKVVVSPLETNCYLLWDKNQTIIIDPGGEPEKIFSLIASPVKAIISTHAHPDHVGALWAVKHEFPQADFFLHQADLPILKQASQGARDVLAWQIPDPPLPDKYLKKGKLIIGKEKFEIIETPGHSPGSVCLLIKENLFTGDTLFAQGVGRTDFPLGDQEELIKSLKKLSQLPQDLIIYPGHGDSASLGQSLEWLGEPLGVW